MKPEQETEVRQLWAVATDLLKIASASTFCSSPLMLTDVEKAFATQTPPPGSQERECTLLIAHLTDVATRLKTINNVSGINVLSDYGNELKRKTANEVVALVKSRLEEYICHILRDSPSHPQRQTGREAHNDVREEVFESLSVGKVFEAVEHAFDAVRCSLPRRFQ